MTNQFFRILKSNVSLRSLLKKKFRNKSGITQINILKLLLYNAVNSVNRYGNSFF